MSLLSHYLLAVIWYAVSLGAVQACTDILVTPGASHDGAMIAYNADSPYVNISLFMCQSSAEIDELFLFFFPPFGGFSVVALIIVAKLTLFLFLCV